MSGIQDKYRLDQRLGGGGMAEVFLGSTVGAEGFSRKVAIKRVLPGYSDNPSFAQMFVSEAKISSRLQHPNIVSVLDFDRDAENRLFLVMELVEGKDLDTLNASGVLPIPLVIYLITEVLRGLGHAHDLPINYDPGQQTMTSTMRGVVHRDVSPHNVLLSWEGAVKVSDFGIAKARAAGEATASAFIKGKPAYMSPEQASGHALDGRSDLFAVGIMLWEMLIGRRLFVAEDMRATLAAVLFGQVPKPRALRGDVPKDVERVTMKLLERDLAARYMNAEQAIADLLDCDVAPRDGRALLVRTLAERFPREAPVRGSQLGASGRPAAPMAPTMASGSVGGPPGMGSVPGSAPGQPGAVGSWGGAPGGTPRPMTMPMPSGSMHVGPAATLPPIAPRRRWGVTAIVALVLPLSALATYGVVSVVKGHGGAAGAGSGTGSAVVANVQPAAGSGSGAVAGAVAGSAARAVAGSAAVAASGSAAVAASGSAAVAASGSAAVAASGSAAGSGAGTGSGSAVAAVAHEAIAKHERPAKLGHLAVHAFPALTVFVDRRRIHDTPVSLQLPAGKHVLHLLNTEVGHDETISVTITEGRTTTIDRE